MSSSRLGQSAARAGAMISSVGSRARTPMSMRTWSLPLPVQPWATAVAPYLCAVSTSFLAMSGRPMAVLSGYLSS